MWYRIFKALSALLEQVYNETLTVVNVLLVETLSIWKILYRIIAFVVFTSESMRIYLWWCKLKHEQTASLGHVSVPII